MDIPICREGGHTHCQYQEYQVGNLQRVRLLMSRELQSPYTAPRLYRASGVTVGTREGRGATAMGGGDREGGGWGGKAMAQTGRQKEGRGEGRSVGGGDTSKSASHLYHQLVKGNSLACKLHLLPLAHTVLLNDMSNQGEQVSGKTGVQGSLLYLCAG